MNVVIHTQSYYVRKAFIDALIPNGISLFHSESVEGLIQKISSKPTDIVVLDVIQENYEEAYKLMTAIKNHASEAIRKIGIIMLIGAVDKVKIAKCLQLGAIGFVKSNAESESISKYIQGLYEKIKGVPPERKFTRVSLDIMNESERIAVKFRSPTNLQLIMGVIKDISAGGIAVELVGTFDQEAIQNGMEVTNMQFIIDGKDVLVNAIVVAYQKNFCAFRFSVCLPTRQGNYQSVHIFQNLIVPRRIMIQKNEFPRKLTGVVSRIHPALIEIAVTKTSTAWAT
jgi:DNA-binding NarL/FixJ family response regulator